MAGADRLVGVDQDGDAAVGRRHSGAHHGAVKQYADAPPRQEVAGAVAQRDEHVDGEAGGRADLDGFGVTGGRLVFLGGFRLFFILPALCLFGLVLGAGPRHEPRPPRGRPATFLLGPGLDRPSDHVEAQQGEQARLVRHYGRPYQGEYDDDQERDHGGRHVAGRVEHAEQDRHAEAHDYDGLLAGDKAEEGEGEQGLREGACPPEPYHARLGIALRGLLHFGGDGGGGHWSEKRGAI